MHDGDFCRDTIAPYSIPPMLRFESTLYDPGGSSFLDFSYASFRPAVCFQALMPSKRPRVELITVITIELFDLIGRLGEFLYGLDYVFYAFGGCEETIYPASRHIIQYYGIVRYFAKFEIEPFTRIIAQHMLFRMC